MENDSLKLVLTAAMAALMTYLDQIIIPVMVLCLVMLIDYLSGVLAAFVTHTLNSKVGLLGILKKLSYLALVTAGCVIDYIISTVGAQLGTVVAVQFVGQLVVFWLIVNELISILENIQKAGGPEPPAFVSRLLKHLRGRVEESLPELPEGDELREPEDYVGRHERHD